MSMPYTLPEECSTFSRAAFNPIPGPNPISRTLWSGWTFKCFTVSFSKLAFPFPRIICKSETQWFKACTFQLKKMIFATSVQSSWQINDRLCQGEFQQATWPWDRGLRQQKWRQTTLVETVTATWLPPQYMKRQVLKLRLGKFTFNFPHLLTAGNVNPDTK